MLGRFGRSRGINACANPILLFFLFAFFLFAVIVATSAALRAHSSIGEL
jgi:hypothetical protein